MSETSSDTISSLRRRRTEENEPEVASIWMVFMEVDGAKPL